jgi:cytidine deaminase
MNIRRKAVAYSKEQIGAMTVYRMQRVVNGQRLGRDIAFSQAHMAERGYVAHRILHARQELRAVSQAHAHG